jgi:ABC transport system ATP-binding/permease protein
LICWKRCWGEYPGTVLVVSHDRDFLDRVATQIVAAEEDGNFRVYAGGYSDMLAQRRAPENKAAPASRAGAKKPRMARASVPKMNFSEAHLLKTLPEKVEALDRIITALQDQLCDPALYGRDPATFARLSAELAQAQAARAADEELWLALALKREEIES